jgi:hypothetical protein
VFLGELSIPRVTSFPAGHAMMREARSAVNSVPLRLSTEFSMFTSERRVEKLRKDHRSVVQSHCVGECSVH